MGGLLTAAVGSSNSERAAVQPRGPRRAPLLALYCGLLLCCGSLCQGRVSPGVRGGRVVCSFEASVRVVVHRVYTASDGGDARAMPLPPPAPRTERLMRSVPSPGVGH
uniref:Uncharacterized protein n=1 Tax=Oryza brachyantha TaxID=4533 RepID=J3L3R1_ORYBR